MQRKSHVAVIRAFRAACETRDAGSLWALLGSDVTALIDSGGNIEAPLEPLHGVEAVVQFLFCALDIEPDLTVTEQSANGQTALVFRVSKRVVGIVNLNIRANHIVDVWVVINPDKLRRWNQA